MEKFANSSALLRAEFAKRRKQNPHYSQRAFARLLGIPSGRLSELMQGKRNLTKAVGTKIAAGLNFSPEETSRFEMLALDTKQNKKVRTRREVRSGSVDETYFRLTDDTFAIVADWQHFAILSLMDLRGFTFDPKWIADRLGIQPIDASSSLDRLIRVGMIRKVKGRWIKPDNQVATTDQVPSTAIRRSHAQKLSHAIESLETVAVEERDISSMSLGIHPKRIGLAKKMIRDFRRRFTSIMERGLKTEVYNLNIQFVPVTKKGAEC